MKTQVYRLSLVKERDVDYKVKGIRAMNPQAIVDLLNDVFDASNCPEEHMWAIGCNGQLHIVGLFEVSHGAPSECNASPRDILKRMLLCGATRFFVAHNHPSGSIYPSKEDKYVTEKLKASGNMLDVELLDHIIIADDAYYSFKEDGGMI